MKLEQLTFSRFLAAISIVIYHYGTGVYPFNCESIHFIFKQANIGVSYFFILSGFVMIIAYDSKGQIDFWTFMGKRFARIYPAFLFAVSLIAIYFLFTLAPIPFHQMLLNLTMMQSWLPGYVFTFNYPSWSITVEMFFYVTFPFLFNRFYKRYSFKKILVLIIAIFILSQLVFHFLLNSSFYQDFPSTNYQFMYYFPLLHLSAFLMGNLAGMFYLKYNKNHVQNHDLRIITLLAIAIIAIKFNFGINYHNGMMALIFVPLIVLMSHNNGILTKISNFKTLIFLGEISYGIYILQYPVFSFTKTFLNMVKIDNPMVVFYSGLIFLIIVSAFSFVFIETPCQNLINKKFRSKKEQNIQIQNTV